MSTEFGAVAEDGEGSGHTRPVRGCQIRHVEGSAHIKEPRPPQHCYKGLWSILGSVLGGVWYEMVFCCVTMSIKLCDLFRILLMFCSKHLILHLLG